MKPARVTLIPGDGVGPEITGSVRTVLERAGAAITWDEQLGGKAAVVACNNPIPDTLLASIKKNKIALKGPLETSIGVGYRSVNVTLRKYFDLYANLRPVRSLAGVKSAFSGVDLIVVRENTEDLYSGIEHIIAPGVVESVKVITARASKRIAKFAFELATREKRKTVTAIHKANIMKLSDGLFLDCARQIAKGYPKVTYRELIVDNACMQLVLRPQEFDVLLLENLYGDIVSDLCAGLIGGLGLAPGANFGANTAVFEPTHGSAPKYTGQNKVNPMAMMLSGMLMLRHLDEGAAAGRLEHAIAEIIADGKSVTYDMKPTRDDPTAVGTSEVADAIIEKLEVLP